MTNGFDMQDNIFSFEGTPSIYGKSGDNSGEATPVPISNTEVKLLSADDTWWEAAWESRTLPVFLFFVTGARCEALAPFFIFCMCSMAALFLFLWKIWEENQSICIPFVGLF